MSSFRIAKNSLFNILAFSVNLAVTFLIVPVMFQYLGKTGFGVWAVVRAFVGYASISDLGLPNSITKFVAEYSAKGETARMGQIFVVGFGLYAIAACAILGVALLLEGLLIETFFSTSGPYLDDVPFVLIGSLLVFSGTMIFSVFPTALNGIQRMDLTNIVLGISYLLNGVLMYLALVGGAGLKGLVIANAVTLLVSVSLNAALFFRFFRGTWEGAFRMRLQDVKRLFLFSRDVFVGALANLIHLHFDKLLLSATLNLTFVSAYEVGSRVVQQIRQIPVLLLNPMLPAASGLAALGETERVRSLYRKSLKYLFLLTFPLFGIPAVFALDFITLWIGERDILMATTLQILMLANAFNLVTGPGYFISLGIGKSQFPMLSALAGMMLNIVLSIVFLKLFGYYGAVMGSFCALVIASLFFLRMIHRELSIPWTDPIVLALKPGVAFLLVIIGWFSLGDVVVGSWTAFLALAGGALVIYTTSLFVFRVFDDEDRQFLRSLLLSRSESASG